MDAYVRLLVSCRLYTTIIRQKKKDFGEIEQIKKYSQKNFYVRIAYNSLCLCVGGLYLRIAVCGRCDCVLNCNIITFFQTAVVSILLYGYTTWTLTKRLEKKLDGNYTRMLRAILNKSWQQHSTKHQLYGYLPPITKTIQARRTRHVGHCWRSKNELVSDVLLWTPAYGQSKAGRPARTYIQQLCDDTGCNPEDLPEAMNDRETWRERVRDIRASRTTWWWWSSSSYCNLTQNIFKHTNTRAAWYNMVYDNIPCLLTSWYSHLTNYSYVLNPASIFVYFTYISNQKINFLHNANDDDKFVP